MEFQRMLQFNVLDYKGSRFEIISWDSNHWRRRLCGNIMADGRQILEIPGNYITEVQDRANRPGNLEVEFEVKVT